MHKPRLTRAITKARCEYLWGQYRRDRIIYAKDVRPKIRKALPARENEIDDLYHRFIEYIGDEHDMTVCDRCGLITSCWDYGGEDGADRLCIDCREE